MRARSRRPLPSRAPRAQRVALAAAAGPWALAARRLRRDRAAVASGVLFGLILLALLAAPLYASEIAGTGPADNHLTDRIEIDGRATDVVSLAGVPIGPTWRGSYFLALYVEGDLRAAGCGRHDRGHDRHVRPAAGDRPGHVPRGGDGPGERDRGSRDGVARPEGARLAPRGHASGEPIRFGP